MKAALMVFASYLVDEGFEAIVDQARQRGGFAAIELAAIYHHARDVHPHKPVHKGRFLDGGALYFRPDPARSPGGGFSRTSPAWSKRSTRCATSWKSGGRAT
jgi:hypothetical protein